MLRRARPPLATQERNWERQVSGSQDGPSHPPQTWSGIWFANLPSLRSQQVQKMGEDEQGLPKFEVLEEDKHPRTDHKHSVLTSSLRPSRTMDKHTVINGQSYIMVMIILGGSDGSLTFGC
jgi:hypothetical protein